MFTSDVIKQLQYYVYRLIDPRNGQTFYIGKGKGNRIFAHVNDALKDYISEEYIDKDEDNISLKIQQIRDIRNSGLEVIHVIQRYGLTEKEAFEVEAALIDCFPGITNIQAGHSADRGANNAEVIQRNLTLKEFDDFDDFKYCIIKIKDYWLNERGNVYETVRRHWKVNYSRVSKIPYVIAAMNGVVQDVFEVERWCEAEEAPGRYMFDGKQAPEEIRSRFVNKRLPKKYMKKGMASPVLYHD